MARSRPDPRERLDRPGQGPLLQGHLKPGGTRRSEEPPRGDAPGRGDARGETSAPDAAANAEAPASDEAAASGSAQPARELASTTNSADAARGKATKSPADIGTRPHLEGSEQGPA